MTHHKPISLGFNLFVYLCYYLLVRIAGSAYVQDNINISELRDQTITQTSSTKCSIQLLQKILIHYGTLVISKNSMNIRDTFSRHA